MQTGANMGLGPGNMENRVDAKGLGETVLDCDRVNNLDHLEWADVPW